jgi:hypothetical protein
MKYILFFCSALLLSINVFSQEWKTYDWQEWKDYQLDNNVTIQVPSKVFKTNLETGTMYYCKTLKGVCLFSVSLDDFQVENKAGLNTSYSEFIRGYINGSNGKLIRTEIIFNNNLEGRSIRSYVTMNGVPMVCESHFYLLKDKMYQFHFMQEQNLYDSLDSGQKHFFDSTRFVNNPGSEAQFSKAIPRKSSAEQLGYSFGRSLGAFTILSVALLAIGVVITTIIFVIRKRKNEN